ncbi:ROK family glucokinase [Kitasatospora sp. NPDC001175]|uniref:ROK family glucokinase n=1 Tax=Kitasatospora sp. NPDC001175 TaxID=3157103 RepID=UPI003D01DAEC
MALTIGVDIGASKIAAGVVDEAGRILRRVRVATPREPDRVESAVCDVVEAVRGDHPVAGVGLGAAGFVDEKRATVLFAKHIGWESEPLGAVVEKVLDLPVTVENDANAAAWGEARFGAGRGRDPVVCVTVGTGIGGGLVVNGGLYRGRYGVAAEFGHLPVVPGGLVCGCGSRGCWEMYGSGTALVREARALVAAGTPEAAPLLRRAGGTVDGLTGPLLTRAAGEGDQAALGLLAGLGHWLGVGLAALAAVLDPACIVIGGGVGAAGELLLGPVRESFREHLTGRGHRPEAAVRPAALGNDAGLVGVADLARRPLG